MKWLVGILAVMLVTHLLIKRARRKKEGNAPPSEV